MTEPQARDHRAGDERAKAELLRYLQDARDALLWKLEGLSEYDARRPLTPTGTNLLGLVKHASGVELAYFGDTFGRPYFAGQEPPAWWYTRAAEPNDDMWATAEESRDQITGLYRAAWRHTDETVGALPLDAAGRVPWWPEERAEVTLHHILVRVISDTQRHAGHADILRESLDGSVGATRASTNIPSGDKTWWADHHARLEQAAQAAAKP
ncbi:DinB family protein [Streptomyces sp. NPDC047097]|uniref:DinB family protein n=1 Tax=Streptomyces sp. NPDC047097 TaxID=3155260 RepID=UPI0034076F3A